MGRLGCSTRLAKAWGDDDGRSRACGRTWLAQEQTARSNGGSARLTRRRLELSAVRGTIGITHQLSRREAARMNRACRTSRRPGHRVRRIQVAAQRNDDVRGKSGSGFNCPKEGRWKVRTWRVGDCTCGSDARGEGQAIWVLEKAARASLARPPRRRRGRRDGRSAVDTRARSTAKDGIMVRGHLGARGRSSSRDALEPFTPGNDLRVRPSPKSLSTRRSGKTSTRI